MNLAREPSNLNCETNLNFEYSCMSVHSRFTYYALIQTIITIIYMYTLTHVYLFLVYTPPCPYHSLQEDVVEVKIDNSVYTTQRCVRGYIAIMYFMPLMPICYVYLSGVFR